MDCAETIRKGSVALGTPLSEDAINALLVFLRELQAWNHHINLTSLTDTNKIIVQHFLDSLSALSAFHSKTGMALADLGSGAGFPGIVLQIARPDLEVTLVESSKKKGAFLHHIRGKLGLSRMSVESIRMEQIGGFFDLLISRAIAPKEILRVAPSILKPHGEVIFFLKKRASVSILSLLPPLWSIHREVPVVLPFVQDQRFFLVIGPK